MNGYVANTAAYDKADLRPGSPPIQWHNERRFQG